MLALVLAVAGGACSVPHQKHPDAGAGAGGDAGSKDVSPDQAAGEAGGEKIDAVVDAGGAAMGKPCSTGSECASAACVDGVCCEKACDGLCMACAKIYTTVDDGTCAPVVAGKDPREACADGSAEMPCGQDGACDGKGKCRKQGPDQVCAPASCSSAGDSFTAASTCDSAGNCVAGATTGCGGDPCATTGCAKRCTGDGDCGDGYCGGGTCKTRKLNGETCDRISQCKSGSCSPDKVCCDRGCTDSCQACTEALTGQKNGTCAFVQAGADPKDDCSAETPRECGHDGTCDGKGGCAYYGPGQVCSDPACSGAKFTAAGACNGKGACGAGAVVDCSATTCTVDGCKVTCTSNVDCGAGTTCGAATPRMCVPKKRNGEACNATECADGACVDGVCCNSTCQDKCYACAKALTGQADGQCAPIQPGQTPAGECTGEEQKTCGQDGKCDGHGACRKWSGVTCGAGTCTSGNQYVAAPTCDGSGHCVPPGGQPCGAIKCDTASGCSSTCQGNNDCLGNTYCDLMTNKCVAQKTQGAACKTASECLQPSCVDGVCCESACTGTCYACARAQTGQDDGRCQPVSVQTLAEPSCAGSANVCGHTGFCDGAGHCANAATGQSCGAQAACVNDKYVAASVCDGAGSCTVGVASDCAPGSYCNSASGTCAPKKGLGEICAAVAECSSGFCCGTCVATNTRPCSAAGYKGPCAAGTLTCQLNGSWSACSRQPAAQDTCDEGNDDSCDEVINGGCACINTKTGSCADKLGLKGPCAAGTTTCANGAWGACSIPPAASDRCEFGNDDMCTGTPVGSRGNTQCDCSVPPMPNPTTAGLPHPANYVDNGDGTVTETYSGLIWEKSPNPTATQCSGTGAYNYSAVTCTEPEALKYCADKGAGWRLPSILELASLTDFTVTGMVFKPAINAAAFPGTPAAPFWTSSLLPDFATLSWVVYFDEGSTSWDDITSKLFVRCVRPVPKCYSRPRYQFLAAGEAYDPATGLTWQRNLAAASFTWEQAKTQCLTPWRLPSINELRTILDYAKPRGPKIDLNAFPGTPNDSFWTSSPSTPSGLPPSAWSVDFEFGYGTRGDRTLSMRVRCVH